MQRLILILGILSFFMDWYVFQGIKRLTAGWQSPRLRFAVYWAYWFFFIAFIFSFGFALYLRFSTGLSSGFTQWVINAFLTLFVTKLVFILVLFAEDVYRFMVAAFRFLRHPRRGTADRKSVV